MRSALHAPLPAGRDPDAGPRGSTAGSERAVLGGPRGEHSRRQAHDLGTRDGSSPISPATGTDPTGWFWYSVGCPRDPVFPSLKFVKQVTFFKICQTGDPAAATGGTTPFVRAPWTVQELLMGELFRRDIRLVSWADFEAELPPRFWEAFDFIELKKEENLPSKRYREAQEEADAK